jgi:hypothetical protein
MHSYETKSYIFGMIKPLMKRETLMKATIETASVFKSMDLIILRLKFLFST